MDKREFEDIEKLFDEEPQLPYGISKENIVVKLKGIRQKAYLKRNNKVIWQLTAAAASLAIIAASVFAVNYKKNVEIMTEPADTQVMAETTSTTQSSVTQKPQGTTSPAVTKKPYEKIDVGAEPKNLTKFSSKEDMKNYFLKIAKENANIYKGAYGYLEDGKGVDLVMPAAPFQSGNANYTQAAGESISDGTAAPSATEENTPHAETNTQVDGVDEADVIKNDGRYIYTVSNKNSMLTIVDTENMKTVYSDKLEPQGKDKENIVIEDIYLSDDRLIVICDEYEKTDDKKTDKQITGDICCYPGFYRAHNCASIVYDVSDKSEPKRLRYVSQDGNIIDSRMIGTVLYTVTSYTVGMDGKSYKEKFLPEINGEDLDYTDVYIVDKDKCSTTYSVITAYDTADENGEINKTSVIADNFCIYSSESTLYVYGTRWGSGDSDENGDFTDIYAFDVSAENVAFKGSGVVPGTVDNSYSLDEKDGMLRIATTDYDFNSDEDISSLYVLNSSLNVIGKLVDIAKDEQIKSVRYIGDYAYVVTFRNTDPLFAINLSDPSNPTVEGSVKLPGFSEYLHPIGNGMLVGVGYCGTQDDADYSSVKVSLFDISDPKNPKELDSHSIKNASSDVNFEPKAFMYYKEENLIGIPVVYSRYDNAGNYLGESYQYKLLGIENGKFSEKQNYVHKTQKDEYPSYFRGTYIDKTLYTVTDTKICGFDIASAEMLGMVDYAAAKEDTVAEPTTSIAIAEGTVPPIGAEEEPADVVVYSTLPPVQK